MESLYVILISAMPIFELRAGIPLAIYYGFEPPKAYFLAVIGNFLPVPLLLIFLEKLLSIVKKFESLWRIYETIQKRVHKKRDIVERYGYPGLIVFVAIPLPITGAWTACLLAFLLGLNNFKASISILLGILIAGIIVLAPILGVIKFFHLN
ncbi:MAG: small multi-drug export protein [Archaeoglobaceae archaeon]|nr:small multi-drug export protein [Archaeoglobaceae archaeon]MDW7989580.1 small multi-drug export protein [Archaeoglobaceae archaeon]